MTETGIKVIAVCGLPGSFSEAAAKEYLSQSGEPFELQYFADAKKVVAALQDGAPLGVVPTENSVAGKVAEAEAIPKDIEKIRDLTIPVRHQLLVRPGTGFESIRRVVSHEQALTQCAKFLRRELPDAEQVPFADTAQAAKDLTDGKLNPTDAVIASDQAGRTYGLEAVSEHIQDDPENRTHFLVFALSGR